MGCDTLTGDDLESDAVSATTDVAAIPAPPSRPVLLLGSKCFALVTVAPPDDFGGAYVTGMTIGIFLSTGALHESFSVTLFPGEITIRNLLAYSSYAVKAALNTTIGDSGFGEALVFTTKDPSPPGKLTLLEITDLGSSSLIVRWKGPQDTGGGAISAITATGTQDLIYNGSTDASKTSFLVGGLLASTKYVFAAIPVNQYGLAGMDDDHLVYATTFGQEVPFPPTDIKDSKVDAGYVELSFSEPFYTGGFPTKSLHYTARLQSLSSCFNDISGCSTCSHSLRSNGDIQTLDTTPNLCTATACSAGESCCLTGGVTCGIRVLEEKKCAYGSGIGICRIEGLHFSSTYFVALATVNDKGSSSYSSSIVVTTGEARRPGFPQLELISASGGSISLKWSLPEDTGGAPIVRMSLTVDGDELFDTDSALNYTHCGSLQKSTDYMYAIEIENAAGLTNRATSSFMTTAATPPGPVKLSEPFVDMQSITVPVTLSCDDGGISDGSSSPIVSSKLVIRVQLQQEVSPVNSVLKGDWTALNFTTLSGIPSSPNTSLLFATSTALELALIPPTQGGGGSLSIEVEVASDASNSVVFQNTLDCSLVEQEYECPDTLSVSGLTAEQDDFTYVVAVRATGSHGSSTWERQTYDVDNGKAGKIGFLDSFYRGTEGEDIEVKIARVYGTTTLDENHFLITADEIVPTWTCSLTASGATCLADSQGDNRGYINFGIGEYLKTITLTTFDDAQYEAAAVSLNVTLVSATSSSLSNTQCEVQFEDNGDAGKFSFGSSQMTINENVGPVGVIIIRSGGISGQVSVTLTSSISSSIRGNRLQKLVTFEDGVDNAIVSVNIRSSSAYETRRFVLMLTNPTGGAAVDTRNLTVVVLDQGDLSSPGRPQITQVSSTGGCIGLELRLPSYLGGWSIGTSMMWDIRVGTGSNYSFEKSGYVISALSIIDACGLDRNTSYPISAALRTDSGTSEWRIIDGFTNALSTPTQVLELLASPVTSGYVQLSWKTPFDIGGIPITIYEITVLNRATNKQRILEPPVPELISASGGALNIRVLAPVDCGGSVLMHYVVNIARHTGGALAYRQYELGTVDSSSYDSNIANVSIYGLLSNSEYFVTVSVGNAQGWSRISDEQIYKTTRPTPVSGMAAPTVALEDPGELTIQWNTPLDSGGLSIVGYRIQSRRKFANGSWSYPEIAYDVRTSLARTALITNILANTEYAFSVSGYNFRTLCRPDEHITPSDELHITTQSASVPSQPKNLRMVRVTGGAITLAWDPPRSSGGEALLWYLIKGGVKDSQLEAMANVSAATNSHTLYGFVASTPYEFAIAGENSRGSGLYSPSLFVTTDPVSAPGPPKSLHQVSVTSGGTLKLAWEEPDDSGGATIHQYNVLRDDSLVGVVVAVNGTTKFQDQRNIAADKDYNYSVFASNDAATSTHPAVIIAHSSVGSKPGAPSAAIEAGSGFITLELIPPLDSGGIPFLLFDLTVMRGSVPVYSYNVTGSVFTVTGLYADVQYSVLIQAVNAKGKSEATTLSTTTRAATIPDKMLLPRLVSVTGGRLQFEVLPPPNFGGSDIVDYSFYANRTLNDVVRNSKTGYDLVGLSALTFYSVAVSATNAVGEGEQSDALIVTTDSVTMPGQVWGLIMTSKTYEAIEVEWMMPYDTGGDATAVQFEAEINSSTSDGNMISSATSSVVLSNLEPATLYTIQVRAFNLIGEGPWSTSLSVTTDPVSSGVINFEKDAVDVSEDGGSVTLTLVRTMGGFMPATCTFTTVDGTAIAGDHYVQTSGQVKFNRGVNSQQISIPIIDNDVIDDPEKYFSVSIEEYNNESGTIGEISSVIVTITDDGDAGVVEFGQERYTVSESVSTLTVTIVRTKKFSGNGTFTIKPVDTAEGAVEGVDYKIPIKSIGFSEQETQASCNITIINDSTYQERKLLKLKLDVVSGKVAIDDPTAFLTIEILDDGDTSPPGLPTSVQVNAVSGGMVNVSWIAPEYLGAKNPGELSYFVHVVEAQSGSTREESIKASSLLFPQLKSRTAYEFSIAAKNAFFLGEYTVSVPTLMKEPTPPSSPIGVQVLSQTGGMVTLSWLPPFDSGGLDISRYRVNVSINIDNKPFGTYLTNGSAISIGKLEPVTSYSATVEAINKNELVGEASATISFTTTGVSMPGKPTSVVIAKATGGALLVEMALPLDIGGAPVLYFTLFMTSAQYPPVFRQVYQGSAPSFYATRLAFSTTYKLQYRVTTKVGTSELSDVFTAATTFLTPPDEAQNLAAVSRTGGSVTLSWTQPVDFGGTDITAYDVAFFLGYEIKAQFRQRVSGVSVNTTSVTAKVVGLQANSTSTDTAVSLPDTPRGLTVALATSGTQTMQWTSSDDAGGDSFVAYLLYSDTGAILYNVYRVRVYLHVQNDIVAPSQPLKLAQASRTGGSIGLTWEIPLDSGGDTISAYKLFRNSTWRADIAADSATMTYLDDQGLAALQDYVYTIRAMNSIGLGAVSETLVASTASATVPSAPTRLDVVARGGNLTVTWTPASNSGGMPLTFFHLQVRNDTGIVLDKTTATTQLSFITYGVRASTTYTVLLTSGNEIGESSATTQAVKNGAAVQPATSQVPEQSFDTTGLARWMIVLKLYFPIDNGGTPLKGLNLYQNGTRIRTVD
ncbi:Immunoglobulin-like fold [Phytophthora cactorum]|nr:Immunoglobulin-like fold [Phytophthora cactorum]